MKIAFVGLGAVGKDMVSEYTAFTYSLNHISSGDIIRQHIIEHNLGETDRVNCRLVGNKVRAEHGADFLVRRAIEMHKDNIVLSGLRAVAEATTFKKLGGIIIAIDAPIKLRYEWSRLRVDIDQNMTLEEFTNRDIAESVNTDPNAQNIVAVMNLADYRVHNNANKEALCEQVKVIIDGLNKGTK